MITSLVRLITHTAFLAIYVFNLVILFCLGAIWVFEDESAWSLLKRQEQIFFGSTYFGVILMALPILAILGFFLQGAIKRIRVATSMGTFVTLAPSAVEDCIASELRESETPVRNIWIRASQKGLFGMGSKMHIRAEVTARLSQPVAQTSKDVEAITLQTLRDLYGIEPKQVTVLVVVTDVVPVKKRDRGGNGGNKPGSAKRLSSPENDSPRGSQKREPKAPKPEATHDLTDPKTNSDEEEKPAN